MLTGTGRFRAEVLPEDSDGAVAASSPQADDIVEFYDPTDVFGDLADALAEAFPSVAPELEGEEGEEGEEAGEEVELDVDASDNGTRP